MTPSVQAAETRTRKVSRPMSYVRHTRPFARAPIQWLQTSPALVHQHRSEVAMTSSQTLVLDRRMSRASMALQRARGQRRTKRSGFRVWTRLWAQPLVCDRCGGDMLEFLPVGDERVCIRCVGAARMPIADPELAGAAAVLRVLFQEAELEWRAQWGAPFLDRRRIDATMAAAEVVLRWITPPNQRTPDMAALGEHDAMNVIASFDRVWALRSSSVRTLMGIFKCWRERQAKAQRYFELEAVDRRYAALIAAESAQQ